MATLPRHLDEATLAALRAAPQAHLELAAHLALGCEQCDAFIAQLPAEFLDGALDAALLSLAPRAEPVLDAPGFARVLGRMRPPRTRSTLGWTAAATVAFSALVVVLSPPLATPGDGIKGNAVEVVELKAVWKDDAGALSPLGPGAELPARGALLFRARSPRAGRGVLMVQRGIGAPALLHTVDVAAGVSDLRSAEGAVGFGLDGESGPVTVWLIVRGGPTAPALEAAVEAVHSGAAPGLAIGRFDLSVTPR